MAKSIRKNVETVQSIERASDLLYCFSVNEPELRVNDFVNKTGLNRTTVFRLLISLTEKKLLVRDEEKGTFQLSPVFIGLGQIVSENLDIREEALPELNRLSSFTKETISLNILQANRRVCVEKVDGNQDIRQFVSLGYPYPLVKGASGKILLAHCNKSVIDDVIKEWSDENPGLLNKYHFQQELKTIKDQKYCISKNDRAFGAYSISTPIFNGEKELVGGLSISGLSMRLTIDKESEYLSQAIRGAKEVSRRMGYPN